MTTNKPAARILVVDDIADNRRRLSVFLRSGGYNTLEAANGTDALRLAAEADLILLDVLMPGIDGYEVCRRLRSRHETRFVPVVMVTALDGCTDRILGIDAGADDFLSKPIDQLELATRVRSLLRIQAQRREVDLLRAELTAMVAHDLQTPLRAILTAGMQLGQPLPDPDRLDLAVQVVGKAQVLLDLVGRLLDPDHIAAFLAKLDNPLDESWPPPQAA
jgi:two-component system cell cycle response regulator